MANEAMRRHWTDVHGPGWVEHAQVFDRMLAGIGDALLRNAAVEPRSRVLDVGCGTGTLTAALAQLGARPVGVDISPTMVDGARERYPDLEFVLADAQVDPLPGPVDAVVSRFGVMFFEDPVAAFANIAAACADGARLDFVCWRGPDDNPALTVGARRLLAALPDGPPPFDPLAPGPMAFADDARVRGILVDAGWSAIEVRPLDTRCRFDVAPGSSGVDERLTLIISSDSGRRFLTEVPAERQPDALAEARADLESFVVDGLLELPAACWLVRARR